MKVYRKDINEKFRHFATEDCWEISDETPEEWNRRMMVERLSRFKDKSEGQRLNSCLY